jgi:hypothetical protein
MEVFTTSSRNASLYYLTLNNLAFCDFGEGCSFIQQLFHSSFPKMIGTNSGVKFSNRNWKTSFKRNNSNDIVKISYVKDIGPSAEQDKIRSTVSDFIPFRLLFGQVNSIHDLTSDDKIIHDKIVKTYNIDTLMDFHHRARLGAHRPLLIV